MNECKYNYHIFQWFDKARNDEVNHEMILLVFPKITKNYSFDKIEEKLEEELKELNIKNCKLVKMNEINSLNEIKKDTNIILLGYRGMNIEVLKNLEYTILFCSCYLYKEIIPIEEIKNFDNYNKLPNIEKNMFYDFYIKALNPIEIIQKEPVQAFKLLKYIFENMMFNNTVVQTNHVLRRDTKQDIFIIHNMERDIKILLQKKLLTARLAINIYKMATFRFDDSDTYIGLYYSKKLGIKSKSKRITNYKGISTIEKIYDLNRCYKQL